MEKIINAMQNQLMYMVFIWILVFISMAIDLFTGIRKAKKNGEATTSNGLRKTCKKAIHYFVPLAAICVLDLMLSIMPAYELPFGTIIYGVFCAGTEFFSVFENTHTKKERKHIVKSITNVLTNLDEPDKLIEEVSKQAINGTSNDDEEESDE